MNTAEKNRFEISKNRPDIFIYMYVSIVLVLLFLRNGVNVGIPVIIVLLVSTIPIIFGNDDCLVAYAVTCIPFSAGFQFKYGLLLCIFVYFIKHKGKLRFTKASAIVLVLLIWELLHAFYGSFSLIEYFRGMSQFLFLLILFSMEKESFNYKLIFRSLAIGVVGVCAIVLYMQLNRYSFNFISAFAGDGFSLFRFGAGNIDVENYGLNFNSNNLGFICNVSIVGIMYLYSRKEASKFDMLLLAGSALFGFLTLSRTFVVCLFINLCLFIISQSRNSKRTIKTIAVLLVSALLVYYLIERFLPQIFSNIFDRFRDSDITNGRGYLFAFYNNHIISSLVYFFFGIGSQDYAGKIIYIYGERINVPHNGLQEIWVVWGIVGVILIILLFVYIIKETKQLDSKRMLFQFIPLIHLLIDTSMGQFMNDRPQLTIIIVYISLCSNYMIANHKENHIYG